MTIMAWMLFSVLIGGALCTAGAALEAACRRLHRPVRWAWAFTLVASVAWPLIALWLATGIAQAAPTPAPALLPFVLESPRIVAAAAPAGVPWGSFLTATLIGTWTLTTAGLLLLLGRALYRVGRLRTEWRRVCLDGVDVWVSADVGPAVIGAMRGDIVVPEWTLALAAPFRALMLRHESEHRGAGDPALLLAAALLWRLVPWNPALWYQAHRLRRAIELDCDARVLAHHGDAERYGRLLITIGQQQSGPRALPAPTLSEPHSQLERRIRAMTQRTERPSGVRASAFTAIAAASIVAACAIGRPEVTATPTTPLAARTGPSVSSGGPFYAYQVSTQAEMLPKNEAPVYPSNLRTKNISGLVVAQFVVGADGVPDTATFKVIKSSHPEFTRAVKQAVATWKYRPALLSGNRVSQIVQQPFEFLLNNQDGAQTARAPAAPLQAAADTTQPARNPYYTFTVSRRATPLPGSAAPVYPPMLRAANVEGNVTVTFVVNADSTASMSSFRVVRSTHDLFTRAVRNAIAQWRFSPATVKDRPVAQLLSLTFRFALGSAGPAVVGDTIIVHGDGTL